MKTGKRKRRTSCCSGGKVSWNLLLLYQWTWHVQDFRATGAFGTNRKHELLQKNRGTSIVFCLATNTPPEGASELVGVA